jgi:hypothetical protein
MPIERDADGLEQAVRTLFEESFIQHRLAPQLERMNDAEAEHVLADLPIREITPGYYQRAAYLVDLTNTLTLGIPFPPECFTQSDVAGIAAVRRARAEFEREHPGCPACGERQDHAHTPKCFSCGQKLRRASN